MKTPLYGLDAGENHPDDFSELNETGFYKQGKGVNQDVSEVCLHRWVYSASCPSRAKKRMSTPLNRIGISLCGLP
jgi:hypothetical protein